ncbi:MAG: N-acetyltransferase [Acidisphaera sp.]|nr:N-acetyltransferase [Acidisphaera sp.]
MHIRPATAADAAEIQAIYAHHVLHGTGTFEEVAPSVEEIAARLRGVTARNCPWLVRTDATGVLGYAYYTPLRDRSAYRFCVENSVYVRADVQRSGTGRALMVELIASAEAAGLRQMIAVIGDAGNAGSIGLHASLGFRHTGVWHACGVKFGRWLDVVHMQRPLGAADADVPA